MFQHSLVVNPKTEMEMYPNFATRLKIQSPFPAGEEFRVRAILEQVHG